jgi:hypothetical protein
MEMYVVLVYCRVYFQVQKFSSTGKDVTLGNSVGKHASTCLERIFHKSLMARMSWPGTSEKFALSKYENIVNVIKSKNLKHTRRCSVINKYACSITFLAFGTLRSFQPPRATDSAIQGELYVKLRNSAYNHSKRELKLSLSPRTPNRKRRKIEDDDDDDFETPK